ncbi:hypothetical protein [Mangrovihabitans endophyticus]|uniref:Uncharacterized protein n=1 Tax=Mangrovihabitans endophyticus TaxID=1751298 RepID=A0A8J3C4Q2_9ACTN|nr:hypothetical protein [Mangrovihabitans endophyticus]GGL17472.1 hypothetical protein GCM10012284_60010 [Mangrovihabitans endophyticus]
MRVDVLPALPESLLDESWRFYHDAFSGLAVRAAARHLLLRREFDELMADERILKYVARDGAGDDEAAAVPPARDRDRIIGLAAMTSDLEAVPLISPPFFAHRWPQEYADGRIFYCVFIGAQHGPRGKGVFVALQRRMWERVGAVRGRVVLDICQWNEAERDLPRAVEGILTGIAGGCVASRLDSQSFWGYEFPAAS